MNNRKRTHEAFSAGLASVQHNSSRDTCVFPAGLSRQLLPVPNCGVRLCERPFARGCAFNRPNHSGRSAACQTLSTGDLLGDDRPTTFGCIYNRAALGAVDAARAAMGVVRASAARRVTTPRDDSGPTWYDIGRRSDGRLRATSSSGRAPQWHCGGAGFESPVVHPSPAVYEQCEADRSIGDAGATSLKPARGRVGAGDHRDRHALHGVHLVGCGWAPGLAEYALPPLLACA